jgi:hypothetical protein
LANTLKLVGNSIQLNRNLSTLDDGTLGPFGIQATQNSVSGTSNFNLIVSPVTAGTITTRTLTETSGSSSVPVGSPFRCGVGFKRGDVPAGASFNVVDRGGNLLSVQADAVNHWADGSLRWCEVRGYTAQAIGPGGTDTPSFVRSGSPFNNTLPNGKTPAQLLTDLKSFSGAQDLNLELSSMVSCTGHSNVYTSGTWTAHANTLLAGSYVQQVNKGPCCMGFTAWGQLSNGSVNHAHIHVKLYIWLWLNPATGAIRDVEYIWYIHNSLLTQSLDGVSYATFPPDRYNYNPALKNGSTVIVNNSDPTMFLNSGGVGTIGGHHSRSGWWTARANAKTRWINNSINADNLHLTFDPIQSNPQTVTSSRDYFASTGLFLPYDIKQVDVPQPWLPGPQPTYSPMTKFVMNNTWFTWNIGPQINAGGNGPSIGVVVGDTIVHYYSQSVQDAINTRLSSLGWCAYPYRALDVNGRIPNVTGVACTGLTAPTNQSLYTMSNNTEGHSDSATPDDPPYAIGGGIAFVDGSHWPNGTYYQYLVEGGAHHRDCCLLLMNAPWAMATYPPLNSVSGPVWRNPSVGGTIYYGNTIVCNGSERLEAWAFRDVVLLPAILPEFLADGTRYGELDMFRGCLANSCAWGAQVIANMDPTQVALGIWAFYGVETSLTVPVRQSYPADEPWMQGYISEAWAMMYWLYHDDTTIGTNVTTLKNFQRKFHDGIMNSKGTYLGPGYYGGYYNAAATLDVFSNTFKDFTTYTAAPGDSSWGVFPLLNMLDTVNGWCGLSTYADIDAEDVVGGPYGAGATGIKVNSVTVPINAASLEGSWRQPGWAVAILLDNGSYHHATISSAATLVSGTTYTIHFSPSIPAGRSVPNNSRGLLTDSGHWDVFPYTAGATPGTGTRISFTTFWYATANVTVPPPFVNQTSLYRMVTVDLANRRFKLCLDSDAANTVLLPSTPTRGIFYGVAQLDASVKDTLMITDVSDFRGGLTGLAKPYPGWTGGAGVHEEDHLLGMRLWRWAAGESATSAAGDASLSARIVRGMSGGVWDRSYYRNFPNFWIKAP